MNRTSGIASLIRSVVLLLTSTALCGGTTTAHAATAYIVSGMVTAPGGVIASSDQTEDASLARVLDFFIAPAEAKLSGLLPVPNGTPVDLVRVTDTGRMSAPIATARVQYGRYQFNLSALRRTVSSRLLVRVDNVATGAQMRAFVTDKAVNINPVSETAVRMALDTVASSQDGTLDNFTVTELADLTDSLDLLTSVDHMRGADDIETSVSEIRNAVAGNRGIVSFLTASARPGQTKTGPGDIGNFFPFTKGISWTYRVRKTEDGIASAPYTNTVLINGTRVINGVTTTVFRNSNSDGDGVAENDFNKKTSFGVYDWELVRDGDSNRPHQFVRFPAAPGSSFKRSLHDMGLNRDVDRDGIVERFTFTMATTVVGLGRVSVPAGNLPNTLKIRTTLIGGATVSSTRKRFALTVTAVEWYTQNLGLSKQTLSSRMTYDGKVWKDSQTMELTEANGFPFTGEFPLDRSTSIDVDANDIVYEPISGKLYASVRSEAANYANIIAVIDPVTAQVESTIHVGVDPGPLAVSDDGQFLYVGLNGSPASILQISIPTLTAGPEWILSDNLGPRYPHHIDVQPGNPAVLAVTTTSIPNAVVHAPNFRGAMILDNGIERPISIPWKLDEAPWQRYGPIAIEFSNDPSIAYGYNWYSDFNDLLVLSIDLDGVTISETKPDFYNYWSRSFKHENGRLYTNRGYVYDPADGLLGTYPSEYDDFRQTEPDSVHNSVAMTQYGYDGMKLEVFAMDSYVKQRELRISTTRYEAIRELEGCGNSGYAMRIFDGDWFSDTSQTHRIVLTKLGQSN